MTVVLKPMPQKYKHRHDASLPNPDKTEADNNTWVYPAGCLAVCGCGKWFYLNRTYDEFVIYHSIWLKVRWFDFARRKYIDQYYYSNANNRLHVLYTGDNSGHGKP